MESTCIIIPKKVIERYIERMIKIMRIHKNFYLFRQRLMWQFSV